MTCLVQLACRMFEVINLITFFCLTSVRMECEKQMLKNISQKNKGIWLI